MSEPTSSRVGLDAASLARLQGRAMCLVSGGIVHGLNNSLAFVSTHVQVSPGRDDEGALAPALERAGRCLWVLDQLSRFGMLRLDGAAVRGELTEAGAALRAMADVVIVERATVRLGVDVHCDTPLYLPLPAPAVLVATLLAVESVAGAVPALLPGRLVVAAARTDAGARIAISFVAEPGHLPFRVTLPPVEATLRTLVASLGGTLALDEGASSLAITLPASPAEA
jgi:hypothetical protein